jgi:hypothetical protein
MQQWYGTRETSLGKLWMVEGIGRGRQEDDLLCKSGTAKGMRASGKQSRRTVCRTGALEESDQE